MADLTRHLVNDAWGTACNDLPKDGALGVQNAGGSWHKLDPKFSKYCYSRDVANEFTSTGALSAWGWGTSVICTWAGFILLFVSIFWALSFPAKIKAQWRAARNGRRRQEPAAPVTSARDGLIASAS